RFGKLAPFVARSEWGFGVDGGALFTSEGELQAQLTGRLAWLGHDGSLWLGGRNEIRIGNTPDTTTAAVAAREKGPWFVYGGSFGRFFFEGGYNLRNDASVGRAGWMWGGSPPRRRVADFAGEVGVSPSPLGFATQVRWKSPILKSKGARFLVDYRFGHVPGVEIEDQRLKYQQLVAGLDLELRRCRWLVPFVYGAVGWHFEELKDDGDHPPFPEQGGHAAAVQLGVGLRIYYLRSERAHYALALSADGWLLSRDAVARSASRELRYLEPKLSLGLRLTIEPVW
ncbi:MAG: hypothetical protein GY856_35220, partial [bacterium]|nr:hypothetical protein [bacterium]